MTPDRQSHRENIKKTVARVTPNLEIDTTKVMTDEEMALLQKEMHDLREAQKLAAEVGREGLRERLKRSVVSIEKQTTRYMDPEELKRLREEAGS